VSYFESSSVLHSALIIPAKRTGEIQRTLGELIFREPKRKSVYPLEEGLDYAAKDLEEGDGGCCYDPRKERKLVLIRLGPAAGSGCASENIEEDSQEVREANMDEVWQDPRLRALLELAVKDSIDNNDSESVDAPAAVAPIGKCSVRQSCIRLPATPYSLLTVDQVLRRIMPGNDDGGKDSTNNNGNPAIEEIPSSFEIAGHVAHVNLRDESLPYKYLIGKAILDKNRPKIRIVVNKIGNIENEFRTFPMEILAGEGLDEELVERLCAAPTGDEKSGTIDMSDESSKRTFQVKIGPQHRSLMQVEVKEHGCRFRLDFARVYFNSRLQGEHDRLVQQIVQDAKRRRNDKDECVVADAMAGVGPFVVPLTSANAPHHRETKIVCHANDLNPVSYEYLEKNAKLNRCFSDRLSMYNLDARQFIHNMNGEGVDVDHFIMNLPQLGPEFLDAFRGWEFHENDSDNAGTAVKHKRKRPMVHVHCFGEKAKGPEETARVERQVRERCETALGYEGCLSSSSDTEYQVRVVRDVGPRKNMLCVSFRLPLQVGGVEKLAITNDACGSAAVVTSNGKRDRTETKAATEDAVSNSPKRSKES